jgi:large subunit ribosomal protein L47
MSAIPTFRIARHTPSSTPSDALRFFLTPASHCTRNAPAARFSTSSPLWKRRGDNNKDRGNSAVRGTGLRKRQVLSVDPWGVGSKLEIPKPTGYKVKVRGDGDHGLWGFFKNRQLLATPPEESRHGMRHFLICSLGANTDQGGHGLSMNYARETGKHCNNCGGYA